MASAAYLILSDCLGMSSGLPWFAVSQDGVEDDEELAHAGDEGLLAGFAGGAELFVVGGDDGIGAAGDQGGHVEGGAHGGAAAGDGAAAAQGAAVAVDRRDPDQGGDLAAVEMAEFGQLGDQGAQRRRADAGDAVPSRSASACQAGLLRIAPSMSPSSSESSALQHSRDAARSP